MGTLFIILIFMHQTLKIGVVDALLELNVSNITSFRKNNFLSAVKILNCTRDKRRGRQIIFLFLRIFDTLKNRIL